MGRGDGEFRLLEHAAHHGEDVALIRCEGVRGEGDSFEPFAFDVLLALHSKDLQKMGVAADTTKKKKKGGKRKKLTKQNRTLDIT